MYNAREPYKVASPEGDERDGVGFLAVDVQIGDVPRAKAAVQQRQQMWYCVWR